MAVRKPIVSIKLDNVPIITNKVSGIIKTYGCMEISFSSFITQLRSGRSFFESLLIGSSFIICQCFYLMRRNCKAIFNYRKIINAINLQFKRHFIKQAFYGMVES